MSKLTEEEVRHVANLSKLSFNDEEVHILAEQLEKITDMVEQLNAVDTTGVDFISNISENVNIMREDLAVAGMNRDELMKNVPEKEDGYIKVPAMLEGGGEA